MGKPQHSSAWGLAVQGDETWGSAGSPVVPEEDSLERVRSMGKLALILLSGNNTEDSSREIPMGFVCMALTHSPVRGAGPTSSTGVRMTLQRLWAEAEWP